MFVIYAGGDRTRVAVTWKNAILEANAIIYHASPAVPSRDLASLGTMSVMCKLSTVHLS